MNDNKNNDNQINENKADNKKTIKDIDLSKSNKSSENICPIIKDILPIFLDKATSKETNALIEGHLITCDDCRIYKDKIEVEKSVKFQKENNEILNEKFGVTNIAKKLKKRRRVIATSVISVIILIIILTTQIFVTFYVSGTSMEPTYLNAESIITNRLAYVLFSPKEGDVVILNHNSNSYIKRIMACPGDTVEIKDGKLYVNNKVIRKYGYGNQNINYGDISNPITLKDDEYFVMGDNTNDSLDSRFSEFGTISKEEIISKVLGKSISFFSSVKTTSLKEVLKDD